MKRLALMIVLAAFAASACGSNNAVGEGPISDVVSGAPSTGGGSTHQDPAEPMVSFQVWFARGEKLWPVMRSEPKTAAVGGAAIDALLAGPSAVERAHGIGTLVPDGTTKLGLNVAGGTATVDLTSEYQSGGGSLSMTMRLAQVVYTLTQFPTVQRVALRLDGQPVTVFSGEGIVLDRPQTRHDYEDLLPVIAVADPGFDQEVASPVRVSGLANVFEANVSVELLDQDGKVISHDFTTATCGTGCWGSFSIALAYHVDKRQAGTIVVHDDDAAGSGTFPHEERIPVVLTP
jgi:germination protein M